MVLAVFLLITRVPAVVGAGVLIAGIVMNRAAARASADARLAYRANE